MPNPLDTFVRDENIKNFSKQLTIETNPVRLTLLRTLLKEELARPGFPPRAAKVN